MKLEIDLVPSTTWYSNLRNTVLKEEWDKIRKRTYSKFMYKCGICGASGKLNCHEVWEYDDTRHIQKLNNFIALCDDCHKIKHMGFANIQASQGLLDMRKLVMHFMKVNGVDKATFERHYDNSFDLWKKRSAHEWKTNLSFWNSLTSRNDPAQTKLNW